MERKQLEVFFEYRKFFEALMDEHEYMQNLAAHTARISLDMFDRGDKPRLIDFKGEKREITAEDAAMIKYFYNRLPKPE